MTAPATVRQPIRTRTYRQRVISPQIQYMHLTQKRESQQVSCIIKKAVTTPSINDNIWQNTTLIDSHRRMESPRREDATTGVDFKTIEQPLYSNRTRPQKILSARLHQTNMNSDRRLMKNKSMAATNTSILQMKNDMEMSSPRQSMKSYQTLINTKM